MHLNISTPLLARQTAVLQQLHLGFPAPRSLLSVSRSRQLEPVCLGIVPEARRAFAQPPRSLLHRRHILARHLLERTPGTAPSLDLSLLGSRLAVCCRIEGDEEQKVGGEDTDAGDGGELFAGAAAVIGEVRPVGVGEVSVGGEVDEACGSASAWNKERGG